MKKFCSSRSCSKDHFLFETCFPSKIIELKLNTIDIRSLFHSGITWPSMGLSRTGPAPGWFKVPLQDPIKVFNQDIFNLILILTIIIAVHRCRCPHLPFWVGGKEDPLNHLFPELGHFQNKRKNEIQIKIHRWYTTWSGYIIHILSIWLFPIWPFHFMCKSQRWSKKSIRPYHMAHMGKHD